MMLAVWVFLQYAQLMLMMLAVDAGCWWVLCAKYAQLMLMMLAVWGFCVRSTPS